MPIRIEHIHIKQGEPLNEDFIMEPTDLNIIYGHNETGKSYIVESIINLLFKKGRKKADNWQTRDWKTAGTIKVSGLSDDLISFSQKSKKQLEDYWPDNKNFPQDFARLLVVKEGEVLLYEKHKADAGRGFIQGYLSGQGLLDRIASKISSSYNNTKIVEGCILGPRQGEIKKYHESLDERKKLEALIDDAQEQYASSEVHDLKQKIQQAENDLDKMEIAKRYHAYSLTMQKDELEKKIFDLPDEDSLSKLDIAISSYEQEKGRLEQKQKELEELQKEANYYEWSSGALQKYKEIVSVSGAKPKQIVFLGSVVFLAGAVVSGFLEKGWIAAGLSLAAMILLFIYFTGIKKALSRAGSSNELERIKAEYKKIFGSELTNVVTLESKVNQLQKANYEAGILDKDVKSLFTSLKERENEIASELRPYTSDSCKPQQWYDTVREMKKQLRELDSKIHEIKTEIAVLGVGPKELITENPGIEWDAYHYDALQKALDETKLEYNHKTKDLDTMKGRLIGETELYSAGWDELLDKTREYLDEITAEYFQMTANILAKLTVKQVIDELRHREDERIIEGLKRVELTRPLYKITGRYKAIKYEADSDLMLVDEDNNEYALDDLSTGAREQVFLAMRMGFSKIAMEGESAFLLLDDAFQHTDWERRTNMVSQIVGLCKTGWQIICFTMDDHVRDLFLKAGKNLGSKFLYKNLN